MANDFKPPLIGDGRDEGRANPGDCLDGSDWPDDWLELTAQPSKVKHYAMFPVRLPLFFMRWLLPRKCCAKCGKAWRRQLSKSGGTTGTSWHDHGADAEGGMHQVQGGNLGSRLDANGQPYRTTTLAWSPACTCSAEAVGATMLDPYSGPGTSSCAAEYLWQNPREGFDTVLADAHMTPTRPGTDSKFAEGDGSQRPDYAKARMCKTGTPTSVFQPWLPGRALMLDLDPACETMHPARLAECFKSLGENVTVAPPAKASLFQEAP